MNVENRPLTIGAAAITLATAILWGGNSVAIKMGLEGIPPLALAGLRFTLGALFVGGYALARRIPLRLAREERPAVATLLVIFIAQIYLLNAGTHYTLAGRSTVFISTYPFFTALFAHRFISGDPLSRERVLGMLLSFVGVAVVFSESLLRREWHYVLGDGMVLASGMLLGGRQVYTKRLAQNIEPARLLLWQALVSVPIFFGLSAIFEAGEPWHATRTVVIGVLYQGVVIAGLCFLIMTSLLKRYRASRIGVFSFVTPVIGVMLSSVLLGEPVSAALIGSLVLVAAGIAIVNRTP